MTARHALETLTLEGYLYRHPRRGTFVAEPRLRFSVGSFTRNMTTDRAPGTEVLSAAAVDPDPVAAEFPRRTRSAVASTCSSVCARPRESPSRSRTSSCRRRGSRTCSSTTSPGRSGSSFALATTCVPPRADARVVAVTLDHFEAEALGVRAGEPPAIVLTRTVFDAEGGVVELARDVYRGDRTEFEVSAPVEGVQP